MRKDHQDNIVGPWAKQKLDALEAYLRAYNIALKNTSFKRIYIDAFAGSALSKVREPILPEAPTFFDDPEDAAAQAEFIQGSPLRALRVDPGFHELFFIDEDKSRVEALKSAIQGDTRARAKDGDANREVRELAKHLRRPNLKGVAFLDPYGAHVEWATLEALAATRNIEVIINFPLAMAINRLIGRSGDVIAKEQIDLCFGTTEWIDLAFSERSGLFGDVLAKNDNAADALLNLYTSRLQKIFGFVATPRLIRNTKRAPLYYLIWAGPNRVGLGIADHILRQGEKVAKR